MRRPAFEIALDQTAVQLMVTAYTSLREALPMARAAGPEDGLKLLRRADPQGHFGIVDAFVLHAAQANRATMLARYYDDGFLAPELCRITRPFRAAVARRELEALDAAVSTLATRGEQAARADLSKAVQGLPISPPDGAAFGAFLEAARTERATLLADESGRSHYVTSKEQLVHLDAILLEACSKISALAGKGPQTRQTHVALWSRALAMHVLARSLVEALPDAGRLTLDALRTGLGPFACVAHGYAHFFFSVKAGRDAATDARFEQRCRDRLREVVDTIDSTTRALETTEELKAFRAQYDGSTDGPVGDPKVWADYERLTGADGPEPHPHPTGLAVGPVAVSLYNDQVADYAVRKGRALLQQRMGTGREAVPSALVDLGAEDGDQLRLHRLGVVQTQPLRPQSAAAMASTFATNFDLCQPVQFYAHNPATGAIHKCANGFNYAMTVLNALDLNGDEALSNEAPVKLKDGARLPDLLLLMALIRAYWYIFAQNVVLRTTLLVQSVDKINPPEALPDLVFEDGSYFVRHKITRPTKIALLIVREALQRWTSGKWLVRPPPAQTN